MGDQCIAFIFARGGSKGVPGKNKRPLGGVPLIGRAINIGRSSDKIDRVVVSTDDEELAEIARSFGADVPFIRPAELAQDDSPEWLSWKHAIKFVQREYGGFKTMVSLPSTCPLRTVEDVDRCIEALTPNFDVVITCTEAANSPYFTLIKEDDDGGFSLFTKPEKTVYRRQDAPKTYDMTAVAFVTRPEFVLRSNKVWDGKVKAELIDPLHAVDIDTELEFQLAEFLIQKQNVV